MTARTQPPFRADHVGSLLRPTELLRARQAFAAGSLPAEELRAAEDRAVTEVVRRQEEVGLALATDGELRRGEWLADFVDGLGGVSRGEATAIAAESPTGDELTYEARQLVVSGRLHLERPVFGDDFSFLARTVTSAMPKLSIPSPSMVHVLPASLDPAVYPDEDAFRADVAATYADELRRLFELGCRYVQLDDTVFAFLNDPRWREMMGAMTGRSLERQHEVNLSVLNQALSGRPDGLTVAVHMCRGNFRSGWFSSGGYDHVAEAVFAGLDVDGFFLEYDDERSGGFEPLRFVPPGKVVVLGLITTKRGALEDRDALARRVEAASRFVALDQLCVSPQCGFASTIEGNVITEEEQWAKLRLVVEVAGAIWG
ncbi:MAG: 5-methyltetrahydropteroyltriglutamate--homocysteine S-methyltransferase [Acidimicrobiales bacterium]|nr:5-methyltetrahydropteroyltriglutamate--homocysteine S-methyltransferase [Acidimicrobiales bacterium]MBO0893860.1 5-methyltetrahydropteroyltriglutamate--homocysteine S-methyltransferase [Acidimicrobiales bacterium]